MTLDLRQRSLKALQHWLLSRGSQWRIICNGSSPENCPPQHLMSTIPVSGMILENGLKVYETGNPLPARVLNDAIRRLRDERSQQILGIRH